MTIFDQYKPFRNAVSTLAIEDSLHVIWAYSQYLQFKEFKFPANIQVDRRFLMLRPPQQWISEWHLEILAKEIILNGCQFAERGRTLRSWAILSNIINKLKDFEDAIPIHKSEDISGLIILNRIAHQQFLWQTDRPNSVTCARYYKIFNTPEINNICLNQLGISVTDLYLCGTAFIGVHLHNPVTSYPVRNSIGIISENHIEKFLEFASRSEADLRKIFKSEQRYDVSFFYTFNSLRAFPLVKLNRKSSTVVSCPLPTLLFWKFTGGLYYDLVSVPLFSQAFGASFQQYVGEAIRRACPDGMICTFPEQSYGTTRQRKDTVDWIIADTASAIFLECKAKRLSWAMFPLANPRFSL